MQRDSLLSTVTSLLCSALQTPLNKLFQFSAYLLPMKEAMWSHYLLTKGIPGLNWAPNLMLVLLLSMVSSPLGVCAFASNSLMSPISRPPSSPRTSAAIISSLIPHTDLHPGLGGNFTACYNFAFVIRDIGRTSKAAFALLPLFRFYNQSLLCNIYYLNLELSWLLSWAAGHTSIIKSSSFARGLGKNKLGVDTSGCQHWNSIWGPVWSPGPSFKKKKSHAYAHRLPLMVGFRNH